MYIDISDQFYVMDILFMIFFFFCQFFLIPIQFLVDVVLKYAKDTCKIYYQNVLDVAGGDV